MDEIIKELSIYKEISIQILNSLDKEDYGDIDNMLEERQKILVSINEESKVDFMESYNKMNIIELDEDIERLLHEKIREVKKELHEYKLTKQVNTMYSNLNREKINIFNKKV